MIYGAALARIIHEGAARFGGAAADASQVSPAKRLDSGAVAEAVACEGAWWLRAKPGAHPPPRPRSAPLR